MFRVPKLTLALLLAGGASLVGCRDGLLSPIERDNGPSARASATPGYVGKYFYGPPTQVGAGQARVFYTLDAQHAVSAIGVGISDAALQSLPSQPMVWFLRMPGRAQLAPWDHVMLDWNPAGHPPENVFTVPHFDFHFYMIPVAQQLAIPGGAGDPAPDGQFIPQGYITDASIVPQMGSHWVDPTSPEFNGGTFTHAFIYGFYQRQMIFVEPMVTLADLLSGETATLPVRQPQAWQEAGWYPTTYGVGYDSARGYHIVWLGDLTFRAAS